MNFRVLPQDVHADSRCRLPLVRRDALDAAGQAIFDHHRDPAGGSLAGLQGPGGIKLHSPKLAAASQPMTRYLRKEAGFDGPLRELAILIAAREMDSQFEWAAHEPEAIKEGLAQAIIDAVKHGRTTDGLPEREATVIAFGRQLFRQKRVAPELFAKMLALFGERKLVDLVSLMGNYAATALLLAAFDMQLPEGEVKVLPVNSTQHG